MPGARRLSYSAVTPAVRPVGRPPKVPRGPQPGCGAKPKAADSNAGAAAPSPSPPNIPPAAGSPTGVNNNAPGAGTAGAGAAGGPGAGVGAPTPGGTAPGGMYTGMYAPEPLTTVAAATPAPVTPATAWEEAYKQSRQALAEQRVPGGASKAQRIEQADLSPGAPRATRTNSGLVPQVALYHGKRHAYDTECAALQKEYRDAVAAQKGSTPDEINANPIQQPSGGKLDGIPPERRPQPPQHSGAMATYEGLVKQWLEVMAAIATGRHACSIEELKMKVGEAAKACNGGVQKAYTTAGAERLLAS